MIDINLVPQHLRKRKNKNLGAGLSIPKETVVGIGGGFIVLLVFVHLLLQFVIFSKYSQHKNLEQKWQEILPAKTRADVVTNDLRILQTKLKSLQGIVGKEQLTWAKVLNEISDHVPRGVWLRQIAFDGDILFIEGSAVSKGKDEMINVHRFASNLNGQGEFLNKLADLEVGSIQRRKINNTEIADFSIKAKLK
ncbi:MAG: PilN domain-containing protein [Candidatus Omnitrophota bacterium]